jgi:hypothetical protein
LPIKTVNGVNLSVLLSRTALKFFRQNDLSIELFMVKLIPFRHLDKRLLLLL